MSAALALPGVAQAHEGGSYTAAGTLSPPTIDGVVNAAEWESATPYSVVFGSLGNATVRFMRTSSDLYVSVVVKDPTPGLTPHFGVFFEDNHNGEKEEGEDAWLANIGASSGEDFYYDADGVGGPTHRADAVSGGSSETDAAGTITEGDPMFELRHPLCSSDETYDMCPSVVEGTVGVDFQYQRGSPPGGFANAPGSDLFAPFNWADLTFAAIPPDTTPPTVRVTAPTAGSVVGGTATAAADASDNVGVDRVEFSYFHGGVETPIGTDNDAPYEVSFDTTVFPDAERLSATLYAVAYDLAGNPSIKTGNGIGLDNTSPNVDITTPAPGSVVRGTITAAADVTDNVGVGAVSFRYFDSATETSYNLGTDTEAPYTATFDSTTVPNAESTGGQFSVTATNLSGLSTIAAILIGVDNTPATVEGASISIMGDSGTIAGAASALISDIPLEAITGDTDDAPSATPLAAIPLAAIPLAAIPLAAIPLAAIPLAAIGFDAENLDQNGLGGVPLSSIPLNSTTDTWEARLNANPAFAGSPVQSVTLAEVMGTSVVTSPTPVSLDDLDLAASPLAAIPLAAIALGGLPLAAIPLDGDASSTDAENLVLWCDFIHDQPGFEGFDCNSLDSETMIGIGLQGVPLAAIPLAAIPLAAIDLAGSPLAAIPLAAIDLAGSPLAAIPLAAIDFASSPLAAIPLAAISPAAKTEILNCTGGFTCADTATLGDAFAAGAFTAGATVEDLGYYCKPGTPADASCNTGDTPILLIDFLNGLPADVTLQDLLASILSETAYDWEALPLPEFPIQDFSRNGGIIDYTASFTLAGPREGGSFTATIRAKIPEGARYVPDSTQVPEGLSASEPTLVAATNELEWQVSKIPANSPQTLDFDVKSPLNLGRATATAEIEIGSLVEQAKSPVNTNIRQTWECSIECEGTPNVDKDTLYFGYTANGDDQDFFRLDVPEAGTQVTVHLSHLTLDDDLVVYGDVPPPLRAPKASTSALQAGDVGPSLQQRTQVITPEVLGDVPVNPPEGQGVLGISDNRGLADEEVTFIVPEDSDGSIYIQISSFDGAYSNEPWMLRVEESEPIDLPAGCKLPPALGGGTTRAMPATVSGSTLYLVNSKRFGDLYGSTAEAAVWDKLTTMAARSDAAGGTVIPIDAIPSVASALGAWEADPCSPGSTNDAVRALGAYLDTIAAPYKYIVLVGDWTVIPPGLILDNTLYANERDYATTFYGAENTQYLSSYALGYLPTDDPYGDTSYSGSGPYVPEVAVGRLVEKPAEIEAQLDQYLLPEVNGAIDPATGLVTGYDFLSDGANAISTALEANVNPSELINDVWSKNDLLAAMFPATNPPAISSINAHYDHHRALPANENTAGTESNLFETQHLGATPGRLVITIGCHSGTPVSDGLFAGPFAQDWDQSYAAKGAIGYVAQSTFGLGETAGVAYSEKLHALLAERLNGSLTVGQALVFAKQEYSAMPLQGGYDVKVINGSGLYGLPMYRVGTGTLAPPPSPLLLETDAATGLKSAAFSLSPSFSRVNASTGSYFTNGGNASFQNRRPIEPFTKLDVTQPDYIAHGALLTSAVSNDQSDFNAAFSRAIEDSAALSPELVGDATSPTRLQSLATFSTPVGPQQRLVISTGQFLADGVPDAQGIGTQRLFSSLGGVVLYALPTATDFSPPTFGPVSAFAASPSTIGFAVDVEDEVGNDQVKRVLALYKDGSGAWRSIDLAHPDGSKRWSGGGPFVGTTAEWFIQAVDDVGNVGVISNKAHIDPVILPPATGGISATVEGPQTNGWYTAAATVTVSGVAGITTSLDGGFFLPNPIVTVSGTGLHTVEYQGAGGAHGTTIVPIDVSDPTVAVKAGIAQVEVGQALGSGLFTCADAGSGIASCTASGIDTSTATLNGATRTFTVTATDRVGRSSTATGTYRVIWTFQGFFQPVDNLPVLNSVKAGSAVPTKFSLGGNQGLNIFAADYPRSGKIACDAADPVTELDATLTAGSSSLSYDAGTGKYTYVWKTDKAWAGTCRQLVMVLADGTAHRANFKFK